MPLVGGASVKSAAMPPISATVCGLSNALSVMVRVPSRSPVVVGVKMMDTWQLACGASGAVQVLVAEQSPLAVADAIVSAVLPLFVIVMLCAALLPPTAC